MGLVPGHSMDLTNGYDFSKPEDRLKAWKLLRSTCPYVVIGSPPCTLFSMLQELNLYINRDNKDWLERFKGRWDDAVQHIDFCVHIYKWQLDNGRHFIHEHPRDARSWDVESMKELLRDPRYTTSSRGDGPIMSMIWRMIFYIIGVQVDSINIQMTQE